MFFQLLITMFLGLASPSTSDNTSHTQDNSPVTTYDEGNPGGDHGHLPPPRDL